MLTPRKSRDAACVACSSTKREYLRQLSSVAGNPKTLSTLLLKYAEVEIVDGVICRNCEKKLIRIEVSEFRDNVKNYLSKRCFRESPKTREDNHISETKNESSLKRNVRVKTKLFSDITQQSSQESVSESVEELNKTPDSGYFSFNLTPILPKKNTHAVGYSRCSTPKIVPNELSVSRTEKNNSSVEHEDHVYDKRKKIHKEPNCKGKSSKGSDRNCIEKTLLNIQSTDSEENDLINQKEMGMLSTIVPLRSKKLLAECLFEMPGFRHVMEQVILKDFSKKIDILSNRKNGKISVLMMKEFQDLRTFKWEDIINELVVEFPLIAKIFLSFKLPESLSEETKHSRLKGLIPRIGLLYSVLAQGRNRELSRVQRLINIVLCDSIYDQKVYDRLQPMGLCLSYCQGLNILDKLAGHYNQVVIDALSSGKRIKIVGDNINWKTSVHDERKDHIATWHHAFGSAVIIQNTCFNHLCGLKPQISYAQAPIDMFLPSSEDWKITKQEYASQIFKAAATHIPYFQQFTNPFIEAQGPDVEGLVEKSKVIPLPVLHYNEQNYEDVVKIMDFYERILSDCFQKAGILCDTKVLVGGDQLTRERFSGAKRLRSDGTTPSERFDHLSPITFELFHLLMNYLTMIFKNLYKEGSHDELGTMNCEANRTNRKSVNSNINENYDSHKDFSVSFTNSYMVEAVLDFFGMDSVYSAPTKNMDITDINSQKSKVEFIKDKFEQIIDDYVFRKKTNFTETDIIDDGVAIPINTANGAKVTIYLRKKINPKKDTDKIKDYAHLVLELGLHFNALLDLCKKPNRDRGLRLLKIAMIHLKAHNNMSKYAIEIIRLLVHQYVVLSEKEACDEFYGLFVNTGGKLDRHIPCDLQMEYIVKDVKRHIKHMFSNKTESNITSKTSALTAINDISENFDKNSGVIVRSKKHSSLDSIGDEMEMINDLRQIKPFTFQTGRAFDGFKNVQSSLGNNLNAEQFRDWIKTQVFKFGSEIGN